MEFCCQLLGRVLSLHCVANMYDQCGCAVLPETRVLQKTKPATYWRLLTSCCSRQQVYVQQIVTPMGLAHNSIHPVTIPADVKPTAELQSSLAQDLQSATSSEVPALCYAGLISHMSMVSLLC